MSAPEVAPTNPSAVSQEITKGIQDIRSLSTCKICTRLMYEPYTTKCGHTFCYGCLSKWLGHEQRKRQCPDCRARIKDEPSPNYTIRGIVHVLISNSAFIDDEETPESLRVEQVQEASQLEADKTGPDGLFRGLFNNSHHNPIRDSADGVMRCPRCNWELEDDYCSHCGVDFDDHFWADWSDDEDYSSNELNDRDDIEDDYDDIDSENSDEPNEEDEAFINDGDPNNNRTTVAISGLYDYTGALDDGHEDYESSVSNGSLDLNRARFQQNRDARNRSEGSTIGASEPETIDSDGDSETSSGSGDSDDDSEEDSEDESSSDSDPEPMLRSRERHSSQRPASSRGSRSQRQHSNIIDLTTLSSPNPSHPQQQRSAQSTSGAGNVGSAATSTPRNSILRTEQTMDNGSETDTPLPVRPRKRVRIVLSDSEGDDDPVDVQRDTRIQRRRLNYQPIISVAPTRNRQRLPITYSSSNSVPGTLPQERVVRWFHGL